VLVGAMALLEDLVRSCYDRMIGLKLLRVERAPVERWSGT
jgi:hypothetical protein